MRIIIAGGSGYIGHKLVSAFLSHGDQVVILSRNPGNVSGLPGGIKVLQWDGKTVQDWVSELDQTDGVINLTGENLFGKGFFPSRWTSGRKLRLLESRVNSGLVLSEAIALAKYKPQVFIQASGINYYGTNSESEASEETDGGTDFLANLCREWEASSKSIETLGVRRVVIRNGLVLGPGDKVLTLLALPYRLFVGGQIGSGKQVYSWIHMDDEVNAIIYLCKNHKANGVFNLVAPEPLTNNDFGKTISRLIKRPHYFPLPGIALQIALGEVASLVLEGRCVMPTKLLEYGYSFKFPTLELALRDLLIKK